MIFKYAYVNKIIIILYLYEEPIGYTDTKNYK